MKNVPKIIWIILIVAILIIFASTNKYYINNFLFNNPIIVFIIAFVISAFSAYFNRRINLIFLIVYIAFIIYMTLLYRVNVKTTTEPILFWSYKQFFTSQFLRFEILNNILLFIPLGAIMYKLYSKLWIILNIICFSAMIELIQYYTGLGLFELDDIISNGLGGFAGFSLGYLLKRIVLKSKC